MRNIKMLTGIRFFAAIHVVFYHNFYLLSKMGIEAPLVINQFVSYGEAAVSFFFILSGFILVHVYKDKLASRIEKKKYLITRLTKIYPLYLVAYLVDIPRVWDLFFGVEAAANGAVKFTLSSFAYLTMVQSWIPRLTPVWNSPGWSISCEIFFYISLMFCMKKIFEIKAKLGLISLMYLFPIGSYFIVTNLSPSLELAPSFLTFWRSFPLLRVLEFFIGVLLYSLIKEGHPVISRVKKHRNLLFWGSVITSIGFTLFDFNLPEKLKLGILLAPFFSIIILTAYFDDIWGRVIFNNRITQVLGMCSYGMYIIHMPIKPYLLAFGEGIHIGGYAYFLGIIIIPIILFYIFELPVQRYLKGKFFKKIR